MQLFHLKCFLFSFPPSFLCLSSLFSWPVGAASSPPTANVSRTAFHERPINVTSVNSQLTNISHFTSAARKFFSPSFLISVDDTGFFSRCVEEEEKKRRRLEVEFAEEKKKEKREHLKPCVPVQTVSVACALSSPR